MRRHGGDPAVVGRVFQMNNRPHTVVGVLPPVPQFPNENDVYMPSSACPFRSGAQHAREPRRAHAERLRPAASPARRSSRRGADVARDRLAVRRPTTPASTRPARLHGDGCRARRRAHAAGPADAPGAAGRGRLRAADRLRQRREPDAGAHAAAQPRAGDARGARAPGACGLVRQLLTESTLLALLGGVVGLALAAAGLDLLVALHRALHHARERGRDRRHGARRSRCVASVLTGVLFGALPALTARPDLAEVMKEENARAGGGFGPRRARGVLVVSQVAFSFMLLIAAGLMLRSFWKLQQVDAGFRPENVLTARVLAELDEVRRRREGARVRLRGRDASSRRTRGALGRAQLLGAARPVPALQPAASRSRAGRWRTRPALARRSAS